MFTFRTISLRPKLEFRSCLSKIYGINFYKASYVAARLGLAFPYHTYFLNTYIYKMLIRFMIPYVWLKARLIRIINLNISKLIEMKSYRGKRQFDNLPCRGQRTRTMLLHVKQ